MTDLKVTCDICGEEKELTVIRDRILAKIFDEYESWICNKCARTLKKQAKSRSNFTSPQ